MLRGMIYDPCSRRILVTLEPTTCADQHAWRANILMVLESPIRLDVDLFLLAVFQS